MTTTDWYGQRGEFEPEPFTYDPPTELRGKLAHYFENKFESADAEIYYLEEREAVGFAEKRLRESLGVPTLEYHGDFSYRFQNLIYKAEERVCVRAIEVLLNYFVNLYFTADERSALKGEGGWPKRVTSMLGDVNKLFRSYMCGYRAEDSDGAPFIKILRMDSEFLHTETVRRPLSLLREAELSGPAEQFEAGVREWSEGNYADAITDANSAFEAVMKHILGRRTGNASKLISELVRSGYLPPYLESGAVQLTDLLELLPRLRDAEGDVHGRLEQQQLPNYARLAINLAGSLIVFLVEEWKIRKSATAGTAKA